MAHTHNIIDKDTHFIINPTTRTIKNELSAKTSVAQYDHNSERFTFEIPKEIEGHDMMSCDIEVHFINAAANKTGESKGYYSCTDKKTDPNNSSIVIFSWLLSGAATKYAGALNFVVKFKCKTDGKIDYVWNTAIYKGVSVTEGIDNSDVN